MSAALAPDTRATLFAAFDWYADVVEAVRDDQLHDATPCTEYDVRQLMAHVSVVLDKVIGFATDHRDVYAGHGLSADEEASSAEAVARQVVDGHTGAERAAELRQRVARARDLWGDDALLDTPIQLGWGPILPGRVVSGIYVMESLAHSWDLATVTGQSAEAPPAVAEVGLLAATQALPPEMPRGIEYGVPFGPAVEPASDAGPTERLANWTGRVSR